MDAVPAMRMPVKIVGTADGRMTFWNSRKLLSPNERAARISSGSTVFTPAMVFSSTGKNAA
jgi:hypothetical protein